MSVFDHPAVLALAEASEYTYAKPLAIRQLAPNLTVAEVLALTGKKEKWSYCPATGVLTLHQPIEVDE